MRTRRLLLRIAPFASARTRQLMRGMVTKMRPMMMLAVLVSVCALGARGADIRMIGEGVISTSADEFGGAITHDGRTIYFNRSIPRSVLYVICVSHLVNGHWTTPEIAPFSGQYRDSDPVLSPDGKRLYFASDRVWPGQKEPNFDIWYVELSGPNANVPHRIEGPVNTDANEYFASEAADGTLYFASDKPGGAGPANIYRALRVADAYPIVEDLGEPVNEKGVFSIEVLTAPDQSFLVVGCFGKAGGAGDSDLFVTRRVDGKWSALEPLNAINTPAREYSPRFSPDGRSLIFASERGLPTETRTSPISYDELLQKAGSITNGLGNIYSVPLSDLGIGELR